MPFYIKIFTVKSVSMHLSAMATLKWIMSQIHNAISVLK